MAPAFITDANFKPGSKEKSAPQWEKVKKFWKKLGGDQAKLEAAIRKGYKIQPLRKTSTGKSGADGKETAINLFLPVIAPILKWLKGLKNPNKNGDPAVDEAALEGDGVAGDPNAPTVDENGNIIDPETGEIITGDELGGDTISIMGLEMPKTYAYIGGGVLGLALIGGIAAGVIIVALLIYFLVVRRRKVVV